MLGQTRPPGGDLSRYLYFLSLLLEPVLLSSSCFNVLPSAVIKASDKKKLKEAVEVLLKLSFFILLSGSYDPHLSNGEF